MSVEALRVKLFDMVKEVYEKFTIYKFKIDENTTYINDKEQGLIFEINFEKQNIIIYIYTTKYNSARVELTKVVLDNNIFNLYIKENIGGIGTGSATIPTTKFIVVIADKIDQCHYNFII